MYERRLKRILPNMARGGSSAVTSFLKLNPGKALAPGRDLPAGRIGPAGLIKGDNHLPFAQNPGTTSAPSCDIILCTVRNKPSGCIWPAMITARVGIIA
jgi:hypothetical protein